MKEYLSLSLHHKGDPLRDCDFARVSSPPVRGFRTDAFWEKMEALRKRCEEVICQIRVCDPPQRGTGVLIVPGLVLTNFHVLPTIESAEGGLACFFENIAADPRTGVSYKSVIQIPLDPNIFFWGSPNRPQEDNGKMTYLPATDECLDFTVVALKSLEPLSKRLPLSFEISAQPLSLPSGEPVGLAQCPNVIDPTCLFKGEIQWSIGKVIRVEDCTLLHDADADHGSSGGITCNSDRPVALHHQGRGEGVNAGILINKIGVDLTKKRQEIVEHLRSSLDACHSTPTLAYSLSSSSSSSYHASSSSEPLPVPALSEKRIIHLPDLPSFFIGRKKELRDLDDCFQDLGQVENVHTFWQPLARCRIVAIVGPPGAGKSALAAKFATRFYERYQHLYYINSISKAEIETALLILASEFGIGDEDAEQRFHRLKGEILKNIKEKEMLLIFDNINNEEDVDYVLKFLEWGHCIDVLFTSQLTTFLENKGIHLYPLEGMTDPDSVDFLMTAAGKNSNRATAADLAKQLGNLPLALGQAAVYLKNADGCYTFKDYSDDLKGKGLDPGQASALATLENGLELIRKSPIGDLAEHLLSLFSFFAGTPIPFEIVTMLIADRSKKEIIDAIGLLKDHSLLLKSSEGYHVHPAERLIRHAAVADASLGYRLKILRALRRQIEGWDPRDYHIRRQLDDYISHIEEILQALEQQIDSDNIEAIHRLLDVLWGYYCHDGRYQRSQQIAQKHKDICERYPVSPLRQAETLERLGISLCRTGSYKEAHDVQLKAIELRKQGNVLEDSPLRLAASYNDIAITMVYKSDYRAALSYLQVSYNLYKEHPKDQAAEALVLSNMACVEGLLGDVDKAVQHHRDALSIRRKFLDEWDPKIATSYDNLGMVLAQKTIEEVAPVGCKTRLHDEKATPDDRPFRDSALKLMGERLPEDDFYMVAEGVKRDRLDLPLLDLGPLLVEPLCYHKKALEIREHSLGHGHPTIAGSCVNIGFLLYCSGNYEGALDYQKRALEIRLGTLGKEHPFTKMVYGEMAKTFAQLGQSDRARRNHDLAVHRSSLDMMVQLDCACAMAGAHMHAMAISTLRFAETAICQEVTCITHTDRTRYKKVTNFLSSHGRVPQALLYQKRVFDAAHHIFRRHISHLSDELVVSEQRAGRGAKTGDVKPMTVVSRSSDLIRILNDMAVTLSKLLEERRAAAALLSANISEVTALLEKAGAEFTNGQFDTALETQRAALNVAGDSPIRLKVYGDLLKTCGALNDLQQASAFADAACRAVGAQLVPPMPSSNSSLS